MILQKKSALLLATAAFFTAPAHALSCTAADDRLAQQYDVVVRTGTYYNFGRETADDLPERNSRAAKIFLKTMTDYLKQPQSWRCTFPKTVNSGVHIIQSPDRRLRFIWWDEQNSGTMHNYTSVAQWRVPNGQTVVQVYDSDMAAPYIDKIYNDDLPGYGRVYLISSVTIGGAQTIIMNLALYRLGKRELEDLNIIRTSRLTAYLHYMLNRHSEIPGVSPDFAYDKHSKTISLPVVDDEQRSENDLSFGNLRNKRIRYRFNGRYFVRLPAR